MAIYKIFMLPPPALSVVQEASKWPGGRKILFPHRHNLQRYPGSDKEKGGSLRPEQAEAKAPGPSASPTPMSQDIRGFELG